jgi:hypothetical protein
MSWLLSQYLLASPISVRRVLSRPGACAAGFGHARLVALEDGASRHVRNRDGDGDANGSGEGDEYALEGLDDGHWSVLSD